NNAATAESALGIAEVRGTQVAEQAETAVFNADLAQDNEATAIFNADLALNNAATAESALGIAEIRGTQVAEQAATAVFNADLAENNASTAVFNADLAENNAATAESARGLSEQRGTQVAEQAETAVFNADLAQNNASTSDANAELARQNESLAVAALATSEASERQARAQALAVSAQGVLDAGDVELALALSIESGRINPSLIQAQRVLSQAAPLGVRLSVESYNDETSFYETPIINASNPLGGGIAIFHPDSNRVAVAAPNNDIVLYDITLREEVARFSGHDERLTALAFSEDGSRLISSSSNTNEGATSGALIIWSTGDPNTFDLLDGHVQGVTDIAVRPGRDEVASVSDDGTVLIWDIITGREIARYTDNNAGALKRVAWDENGGLLLAFSEDTTVIRRLDNGYDTINLQTTRDPYFIGLSPDGTYGYNGGNQPGSGSLTIWNAQNANRLREFSLQDFTRNEEYVRFVNFSPQEDQHVLVYLEQWQRISGSDLFYRGN
ncbi:MAG: hypothetical protein AAF125_17130, partial [Chloroflexota bacterium]